MRWFTLLAMLPAVAFAQTLSAIDADELSKLNRGDAKFGEVRDAWASLLNDESREKMLSRMREQLKSLESELAAVDQMQQRSQQGISGSTIVFTHSQILERRLKAFDGLAEIQKALQHLLQLQNWYRTVDSALAGLSVDQLEGSPTPEQVQEQISLLASKQSDLQQQLLNPAAPLPAEKDFLLQIMRNEAAQREQSRKPIQEAIRMLKENIDRSASQPLLLTKLDREWMDAHRMTIEAIMK